jgi:hypothetical protein
MCGKKCAAIHKRNGGREGSPCCAQRFLRLASAFATEVRVAFAAATASTVTAGEPGRIRLDSFPRCGPQCPVVTSKKGMVAAGLERCSEPPLHYAADAVLPWATTIDRPPSPRPLVGPLVAPSAPEPLNRCRIGRNSGRKIDRVNGPTDGRIATETTNGRQRPGIASARQLTTVEQEPSRCLHSRGDTYGRIKATALPIAPDRGACPAANPRRAGSSRVARRSPTGAGRVRLVARNFGPARFSPTIASADP